MQMDWTNHHHERGEQAKIKLCIISLSQYNGLYILWKESDRRTVPRTLSKIKESMIQWSVCLSDSFIQLN